MSDSGAPPAAEHRYDSFVVRVWTHGGECLARVQVRHVQTDTVETVTMVDWDWVGQAMAQLMSAGPGPEDAG
jgi:hypothetical protein